MFISLFIILLVTSISLTQADHPTVSIVETAANNTSEEWDEDVVVECRLDTRHTGKDVRLELWEVMRDQNEDYLVASGMNDLKFKSVVGFYGVYRYLLVYCRAEYQDVHNITYYVRSKEINHEENSSPAELTDDSRQRVMTTPKGQAQSRHTLGQTIRYTCSPGKTASISGPFTLTWLQNKGDVDVQLNKASFSEKSNAGYSNYSLTFTKTLQKSDNGTTIYCGLHKSDGAYREQPEWEWRTVDDRAGAYLYIKCKALRLKSVPHPCLVRTSYVSRLAPASV